MTTNGLPGFPTDELDRKWQFEEQLAAGRVAPDVGMRDVPAVPASHLCDGGDLPSVRDERIDPGPLATPAGSLAEQARELVDGDRQSDYGEPLGHMRRVADAWAAVLSRPFTPEEVCLALATLKLVREGHQSKRDNREDAVGYLDILERVHRYRS